MPTNLYGPNDNFHPQNSHVVPALLRRFHEAKQTRAEKVTVWGTGKAMREFLHVDDMADACVHIMDLDETIYSAQTQPMLSHINIGTGIDCTIKELTEMIANVVGFDGEIQWDIFKPDGSPKKLMDVTRLNLLGWEATISLENGLVDTYQWFLNNQMEFRG